MDEEFKIYIHRLYEGREETIKETFSPSFMEIQERELQFTKPITLTGSAYLADQTLILVWNVHTFALIPCAICNQMVEQEIDIKNFNAQIEIETIAGGVFNFKELLRECVLLELPFVLECHNGHCPERKNLVHFLDKKDKEDGYHPFSEL